jgi:hypothetical protein
MVYLLTTTRHDDSYQRRKYQTLSIGLHWMR